MKLTTREKELALSTLLRRDEKDPGAADLLRRLMTDSEFVIRKRAVNISDRYIHHPNTLRTLLRVASNKSEKGLVRRRALEQLEIVFDPQRKSELPDQLPPDLLYTMKGRVLQLLRCTDEPITIRANALQLAAYYVPDDLIQEWILFFHNRTGQFSKLSAIAAMGRTETPIWRKYLQGYLESENMEFICAALEAVAQRDFHPDEVLPDPSMSPEDLTNQTTELTSS